MMVIDLRSDTVTKPTHAMKEAMMKAVIGDDVFGDDPTVIQLEQKLAEMFGKEAAVFCPSGTMTNQIAIKVHTQPLDELICEAYSHVYQYEAGGYGFHSGLGIQLISEPDHKLKPHSIEAAKRPEADWLPKSTLVVLENSCNKAGGIYYSYDEMKDVSDTCKALDLKLHLDGARLFNVLVETGDSTKKVGALFDSISICLSKGLGAPVGSVLIGNTEFVKSARRFRKVMGGGMRQAGILAAAGIFALDHHVKRLREDHRRAKSIADVLQTCSWVSSVNPVQTNIIVFDTIKGVDAIAVVQSLKEKGILAIALGPNTIRFVFHLDLTEDMLSKLAKELLHPDIGYG